jgi:ribosomal protein L37AE/L43A
MQFTDRLNEGVATVASTVKSGVDTCLQEGKILDKKKKIRKLTKEIGKLTVLRLDDGEGMAPEIMERYSAILEARREIEEIESGNDSSVVVCPKCGAKVADGMSFCGNCGAEIAADVEESAEAGSAAEAEDEEEE